MTLRTITKIICISVAIFLIGYDIIPFLNPGRGDTISEVIASWGLKFFTLPFVFGALCGHFFLLRDNANPPNPYVLLPLIIIVVALDAVGSIWNINVLMFIKQHPFIPLFVGIPAGSWLWPQSKSDKL